MVQPVCHDEVVGLEHAVVAANLIENVLRNGNVGSLVLHDEARYAPILVVQDAVAAARVTVDTQAHLVGEQGLGIV